MTIYEKIKGLCVEQGKTIMALEKEAGIANGIIASRHNHTIDTIKKVADTLGVTIDSLIEGVEFPKRKKKEDKK